MESPTRREQARAWGAGAAVLAGAVATYAVLSAVTTERGDRRSPTDPPAVVASVIPSTVPTAAASVIPNTVPTTTASVTTAGPASGAARLPGDGHDGR